MPTFSRGKSNCAGHVTKFVPNMSRNSGHSRLAMVSLFLFLHVRKPLSHMFELSDPHHIRRRWSQLEGIDDVSLHLVPDTSLGGPLLSLVRSSSSITNRASNVPRGPVVTVTVPRVPLDPRMSTRTSWPLVRGCTTP